MHHLDRTIAIEDDGDNAGHVLLRLDLPFLGG